MSKQQARPDTPNNSTANASEDQAKTPEVLVATPDTHSEIKFPPLRLIKEADERKGRKEADERKGR